jgi:deoxyribose-phosphate aldolase
MIIEYSIYDIAISDEELKKNLNGVARYNPSTISVLPANIKLAKNIISSSAHKNIKISTCVDYPLGILDIKTRNLAIESCIKSGAETVAICAPSYFFCNRKYDKFREDIKSNLEICSQNNIKLRYFLEYRVFTYELLYRVSQILLDLGIDTIYPSTGYSLDDINDNIIAAALINKKVPINIICNGNIWNNSQINNISQSKIYGIKVNSINALDLLNQNNIKS